MADKVGFKAQVSSLFADNTNEDITPEDVRTILNLVADSFANLEDTASITGVWTYQTNVSGIAPTSDLHFATKKYVDDNVGLTSGDVVGPSSATDNELATFNLSTGKLIQANTGVTVSDTGNFAGVGNISFGTALNTIAGIENQNLLDKTVNETIASGAVWTFTDSPIVPTPTTDFQAATKKYVDDSGSGTVTVTGTPVDSQLAVWTAASDVEGDANLTWNGSTLSIGGAATATTFNGVALTTGGSAANVLAEDGTYVALSGGGDVVKVGTPVNNQIAVWTGDGTAEGDANLTWSGSTLAVTGSQTVSSNLTVSGATALTDTTIEIDNATTNASVTALEITRTTSGTPAVGIGVDLEFHVETSASNTEKLGVIEVTATDVTAANEDGKFSFKIMDAGTTPAEKMAISSAGNVTATSFNGVALTDGGAATNFLTEAGTYVAIGSLGGGDVNKVGTPVNNQIAVWTGDGTAEGDANFTWDGSTVAVVGALTTTTTMTAAGVLKTSDSTNATSTTTGALQSQGGLGVNSDIWGGGDLELTKDTTGSSSDPVRIVLNSEHNGTWTSGTEFGRIDFTTDDTGGSGAGSVRASVRGYLGSTDGSAYGLRFYTHDGTDLDKTLQLNSAGGATFSGNINGVVFQASGIMRTDATDDASSTTSGALRSAGGLGVVKKAYFGDDVSIAGSFGSNLNLTTVGSGTEDGMNYINSSDILLLSKSAGNAIAIRRRTSNGSVIDFFRDTSIVGSISVTTTNTAYNTSSDYRLKEDLKEIKNPLNIIDKLKVYDGQWIADKKRQHFMIAHELQEQLNYAVLGQKDQKNEDGTPVYQQVDYSKIVPILVEGIKQLNKELNYLKNN